MLLLDVPTEEKGLEKSSSLSEEKGLEKSSELSDVPTEEQCRSTLVNV